jgi:hypothetical protein
VLTHPAAAAAPTAAALLSLTDALHLKRPVHLLLPRKVGHLDDPIGLLLLCPKRRRLRRRLAILLLLLFLLGLRIAAITSPVISFRLLVHVAATASAAPLPSGCFGLFGALPLLARLLLVSLASGLDGALAHGADLAKLDPNA